MTRLFVFVSLLFYLTGFSQTRTDSIQNAYEFADKILPAGEHSYRIIDFAYPQGILDISLKMQKAIAADMQWYLDYANKNYVPGVGLPYNARMGITQAEYEQIRHMDTITPKRTVSDSGKVVIDHLDGTIIFHSQGSSKLLNYLVVNQKQNLLVLGSDKLNFGSKLIVKENPLNGSWEGYSWELKTMQDPDTNHLDQVDGKNVEVILAKTMKGQAFIRIKYQQIDHGQPKINNDLLFYVD